MRGHNRQPDDMGIGRLWARRALPEPGQQDAVLQRTLAQQSAAAMRDLEQRLAEEQALRRIGKGDTARSGLPGDREVVEFGRIPAQAEFEPALARRRAMTRPLIAPDARQHRNDIVDERDSRRSCFRAGVR